ncbi:MAG: YIP1 family protein, partial [Candidatus Aminicenantales bacterium]
MSLVKRIEGVFFSPRSTFEGLAAKPVWVDTLIVVLLALIAFNFIVLPYMQKDQLSLMKDNAALKERMGEDSFAKMIDRTENPSKAGQVIQIFVTTPLFYLAALLLQGLILLILGRFMSTQGAYVQVLSVLVHASLVNTLLGNAVRLLLALTRKSLMQTSTSLALLFPHMEVTSTPYIVLTQIDFFQLWMFGILAFGLAAVFKIQIRKALMLSYGVWFLKALANVGIGLIGMSFL